MTGKQWIIGGQKVQVNASTETDSGLLRRPVTIITLKSTESHLGQAA